MKIFLSWSGNISHEVAIVLREWLPLVLQSIEPYVSSEDLDKGTRWSTDIAQELEKSSYGILCVTKDNLDAPWLNFEAGALSKSFEKSKVSPFLFNLKRSDVKSGPLLQFQSTLYNKSDLEKLIKDINRASPEIKLPEERLKNIFEVWWPKLDENLKSINLKYHKNEILDSPVKDHDNFENNDILEELLELTRNNHRILSNPSDILSPEYLGKIISYYSSTPTKKLSKNSVDEISKKLTEMLKCISGAKENKKRSVKIDEIEDFIISMIAPINSLRTSIEDNNRYSKQLRFFAENEDADLTI